MGRKESAELLSELERLKLKVNVGDRFSHYKHPENKYLILAVGFIESSEEICIVYQAEYGDKLVWVRTENEFFSKATLAEGKEVDRFTKLS